MSDGHSGERTPAEWERILPPDEKPWWPVVRLLICFAVVQTLWMAVRRAAGLEPGSGLALSFVVFGIWEAAVRARANRRIQTALKAAGIEETWPPPHQNPKPAWAAAFAVPILWTWWTWSFISTLNDFLIAACIATLLAIGGAKLVARVLSRRFQANDVHYAIIIACAFACQTIAVALNRSLATKLESSLFYSILDIKMIFSTFF